MQTRRAIIAFSAVILALVALHPPWIIHAVAYRMSFEDFPQVPPRAVVDTVAWRVPVAPIYLRRSLTLNADELAAYEARLKHGDTSAVQEWRQKIQRIEELYRVPDSLRADWDTDASGRARALAYQKKITSASFEIDVKRLCIYLLAVVILTLVALRLSSASSSSSPTGHP
jgi:hypothetical protein